MTTITIPRALLEQALDALELVTDDYDDSAVGTEINAIQALRAELAKPDRHALQAEGTHPAPCALHCEAPAFQNEIRALKAELDAQLAIYDKAIDNLQSQVDELVAALKGVIRVADRKTEEFDTARAAIAKYAAVRTKEVEVPDDLA